ncbi:serine hydrolase [Carnobacterium antarcticum]|uniref:Serine hydrolase n=1 Tax=Carnobacterium antarcticum TaxID=2126436 RepID=A0ABW4NKZ2_9LACT|nr:serine hydrolase [Carnobacterium sp. CP1]ALV22412.1 Beta-lactamase [Carnobacterium sp. CP1]
MDWMKETKNLKETFAPYMHSALYITDGKQVLAADQEAELIWAASIIKLPIYLYYYEKAIEGKLDLSETLTLPAEGRVTGSGVLHLLTTKESWTVEELLQLMIAVSDNEATNQLIRYADLKTLQSWIKTKEWGDEIKLRRYLMDYASGLINEVSARGAVQVLQDIIALGQAAPLWKDRIEKPLVKQQFRTGLPGALDEREIPVLEMLNKTGEDNGIRHDVALFRYHDQELFIAALTKEGQEEAKAYEWMQEIGKLAFEALKAADAQSKSIHST